MSHRTAALLGALGSAAVVLGVLIPLVVLLRVPHQTTQTRFHQPADVHYADGLSHSVVLRHVRHWGDPVGLAGDYDTLVIGADPTGHSGHEVRFAATGTDQADLHVQWSAAGVAVLYGDGHVLLVPASAFTYGR